VCQWVEPSEGAEGEGKGVMFFRDHNGLGMPPMKLQKEEPKVGTTLRQACGLWRGEVYRRDLWRRA